VNLCSALALPERGQRKTGPTLSSACGGQAKDANDGRHPTLAKDMAGSGWDQAFVLGVLLHREWGLSLIEAAGRVGQDADVGLVMLGCSC